MDYENDIYRKPVWDEQLAAEDEFNKAMMQVQTQPKVQEDDGGWGDLMKQFSGSVGGVQPQGDAYRPAFGSGNTVQSGGIGQYRGMLKNFF